MIAQRSRGVRKSKWHNTEVSSNFLIAIDVIFICIKVTPIGVFIVIIVSVVQLVVIAVCAPATVCADVTANICETVS